MSAQRPRVVVIEDKESMRKLVETVLSREHDVTTFADPVEALAYLEVEPVDAVVTDVRMPGPQGSTATTRRNRPPAGRPLCCPLYLAA